MPLEAGNFFKSTRVSDCDGCLFGEDTEPGRILLTQTLATEQRENTENFSLKHQRVSDETADAFTSRPIRSNDPIVLGSEVFDQDGNLGRADLSHLAGVEWYAAKVTLQECPIFSG